MQLRTVRHRFNETFKIHTTTRNLKPIVCYVYDAKNLSYYDSVSALMCIKNTDLRIKKPRLFYYFNGQKTLNFIFKNFPRAGWFEIWVVDTISKSFNSPGCLYYQCVVTIYLTRVFTTLTFWAPGLQFFFFKLS